ncbi:MAG: DUF1549 domain-containing protein, partial [Planctomycetes bacterium]|nr:DUF1549 domain-containing protein [Planctomycetota bacterium]
EEYRVEYVCDRVQTFATTFLGLTFECARCHDHKFDPITQKEFYQIFSLFQNIDEAGMYSYYTPSPPTPTLLLADQSAKEKLATLNATIEQLERAGNELRESRRSEFSKWLDARPSQFTFPNEVARYSFEAVQEGKLTNDVAADKPATVQGENALVDGKNGKSIRFTGDDPVLLPMGNFQRFQPFTVALWLKTPDEKDRSVVFHRSKAWTDSASRGYELLIADGKLRWSLIHFWPGNAISIEALEKLPLNEWVHVVVSSDGSSRASELRMTINGQPANVRPLKDHLTKNITGSGGDNITLGERNRDRGFRDGMIDDFRVFERRLSDLECQASYDLERATRLLKASRLELSAVELDQLFEFYLSTVDPTWTDHGKALLTARDAQSQFIDGIKELMVM